MTSQHSTTILEVSGLTFSFENEQSPILKNLSFCLKEDETILALGPSGSGKSTLAYCLNNLYPGSVDGILKGSVYFRGRNTADFLPGEINQKIGLVMQDPDSQFCMLTVEEELAFVLENIRCPRSEMDERIQLALELVNMLPFKDRIIHSLSGGQKQKLAIACALAMQPEILILDEPTANLDPASKIELIQTLKTLKEHYSFSILVIEHNLDHWLEIVDRCLIIDSGGQLIFDGKPRECFSGYANTLAEEGIWLPRPVEAGLKLQEAELLISADLPLTLDEIIANINDLASAIKVLSRQKKDFPDINRTSIFEAENVCLMKDKKEILKNLSLSVKAGEFIAIAGANGSGKTTFSRCIAGLLPVSTGEIKFYELPMESWKEEEKWQKLGYVFQNPEHQFISDSVYQEITYSLDAGNKAAQKWTMKEILTKLRMASHINNHPFSLSQGQKRRLSVAVMLINGQEVLIMDEPTFGQDAITSKELIEFAVQAVPDSGCVIMITHDMDLIDQYADQVLVLKDGEELFFGPPAQLWKQDKILEQANLKLPFIKELERKFELYRGETYAVK